MKMFTQTIALTSVLFAATAIGSPQGLAPPMNSTEFNMQSPSTTMADQNYSFSGIYESALSSHSTERRLSEGYVAPQKIGDFCLITDLSIAANEHSVESYLGSRKC